MAMQQMPPVFNYDAAMAQQRQQQQLQQLQHQKQEQEQHQAGSMLAQPWQQPQWWPQQPPWPQAAADAPPLAMAIAPAEGAAAALAAAELSWAAPVAAAVGVMKGGLTEPDGAEHETNIGIVATANGCAGAGVAAEAGAAPFVDKAEGKAAAF